MGGHIILTFKVHAEGGQYVSTCEELDIASCGDSLQEAFAAIRDAAQLYLTTIADEDERE